MIQGLPRRGGPGSSSGQRQSGPTPGHPPGAFHTHAPRHPAHTLTQSRSHTLPPPQPPPHGASQPTDGEIGAGLAKRWQFIRVCSARGGRAAGGSAPRWGAGRCEALLGPCRPGDSINLQNNGLHHLRAGEAGVQRVGERLGWRLGLALSNMPPSLGHPQLSQEAALSEWPSCSAGAGGRTVSQQPVLAALSTANFGSVPGCRPNDQCPFHR